MFCSAGGMNALAKGSNNSNMATTSTRTREPVHPSQRRSRADSSMRSFSRDSSYHKQERIVNESKPNTATGSLMNITRPGTIKSNLFKQKDAASEKNYSSDSEIDAGLLSQEKGKIKVGFILSNVQRLKEIPDHVLCNGIN